MYKKITQEKEIHNPSWYKSQQFVRLSKLPMLKQQKEEPMSFPPLYRLALIQLKQASIDKIYLL